MDSTVTPTPPKFPRDFTVAHLLDRIGRNPTEVGGDGGLLRKAAHQPDVAALQPDLARPGLDPMEGSYVGAMGPSLGGRASRGLARFLIVFSIGIGVTLAWQSAAVASMRQSMDQLAAQLARHHHAESGLCQGCCLWRQPAKLRRRVCKHRLASNKWRTTSPSSTQTSRRSFRS